MHPTPPGYEVVCTFRPSGVVQRYPRATLMAALAVAEDLAVRSQVNHARDYADLGIAGEAILERSADGRTYRLLHRLGDTTTVLITIEVRLAR